MKIEFSNFSVVFHITSFYLNMTSMNKPDKEFPQTPSQFYRNRRPEYFSDSEKFYEVKLPKEHLAFELSQISKNQKQDAFETLSRRLAEKFISPNLIPQVGPTGGGDGKTDAETYPVSEVIAERWFVPENGWKKDENWAFAISAKQDWKNKVKADVKKIIQTNRGYTKVFFISNQLISSKNKKETQDELKEKYHCEVIILDAEWIIEKIYSNDLISLAVDSLNLSDVYKNEKVRIGSNDASRSKKLEELEEKINNTNRYFEYDYQLVEDSLEAAILSRMLERPKEEILGKFDRALRFAQKLKSEQQLLRIYYQRAWTYIHWYDDYANFAADFKEFVGYATDEPNTNSIELYFNLLSVLRNISYNPSVAEIIKEVNYQEEEKKYKNVLERCIANNDKPTASLIAKTFKSFLEIFNTLFNKKDVSDELKLLRNYFKDSTQYLEYPFETFKKMVEVFGAILPDNAEYDKLIDLIAEISEKRTSELSSGEIFFNRGVQKFDKRFYKDSIIYFGKSVMKFAKEESQDYLYFALRCLDDAYEKLGLFWASHNCILAASSISVKEWYNTGKPSKRFYSCVQEALKKESFIGRVPYILSWYEVYKVISVQFEDEQLEEEIPIAYLIDACLSVRLLNSPYDSWKDFSRLPEIFKKQELLLSEDTSLYILGYLELIDENTIAKTANAETIDDYYNVVANQPFKEQIVYDTNLLNHEIIKFKSIILGTEVIVKFKRNKELAIFAEMVLAFLESFLATSFEDVFPSSELITINIEENSEIENYRVIENDDNKTYEIQLNLVSEKNNAIERPYELLIEITAKILVKNFIFKEAKEYLKNLFQKDELHERQSFIMEHRKFFTSIFGNTPKIFLEDWVGFDSSKVYEFKRDSNPIKIKEITQQGEIKKDERELKNVKHSQTKVSSVIDSHTWDIAKWQGFGFFITRELPLVIFLAFENATAGKQIFENWVNRFGRIDQKDEINVSIIKGVDRDNPFWYRVHISKSMIGDDLKEGQFLVSASRFHELNAPNSDNLSKLIERFNQFKHYLLVPAAMKPDGTPEPFVEFGIIKKKLIIRQAWEIGENDFDSVVIKSNDNPLIPADKPDAPVISLLKKKGVKE